MKSYLKPLLLLIAAIVFLLIGATNYFLLRPHIILFKWLDIEPAKSIIVSHSGLALFFRGYFSDIVWCIALCLVTIALDSYNYLRPSDKIYILLLPFASEIAQYFSLIPGTFDWFDMLAYLLVILSFNIIFPSKLIPVNMQKIKSHLWGFSVFTLFLVMVLACATTTHTRRTTYQKPNDPCVRHGALTYSPVWFK